VRIGLYDIYYFKDTGKPRCRAVWHCAKKPMVYLWHLKVMSYWTPLTAA
jgi:hypothetical protein